MWGLDAILDVAYEGALWCVFQLYRTIRTIIINNHDHHGHHDHDHGHHGQVSGWCVPRELEDEPSAAVGFPLWASSGRIQDGDFLLF